MLFGSRQRLYLTKANTAITPAREDTDGKQSFVKYFCSTPSFGLLGAGVLHLQSGFPWYISSRRISKAIRAKLNNLRSVYICCLIVITHFCLNTKTGVQPTACSHWEIMNFVCVAFWDWDRERWEVTEVLSVVIKYCELLWATVWTETKKVLRVHVSHCVPVQCQCHSSVTCRPVSPPLLSTVSGPTGTTAQTWAARENLLRSELYQRTSYSRQLRIGQIPGNQRTPDWILSLMITELWARRGRWISQLMQDQLLRSS